MRDGTPAPTGLGRRSRRLSEEETERRMLDAALAMVNRTGLTVSLDHLSFEDVIREAGVARSAVYRRWPYKDLFFTDLVAELARAAIPSPADNAAILALIRKIVADHADRLATAEGRHGVVLELFRQAALHDFQTLHGSAQWRTYLALHATFDSLADGQLRDQIRRTLAESEHGFITRVAAAWRQVAELFGYRLRPELAVGYDTIATLASATARGLILMALSTPDLATHQTTAKPFGAAETRDWSLPALGLASIASAFLEPDPTVSWTDDRIGAIRHSIDDLQLPGPADPTAPTAGPPGS
ncbi:MAG TPA: TetR/AcrR family transcriptional regulator [Actinophytocola sp.]|uniref:TetR/AcrR family transcriptional regulator n=1 Tax=Actinophytocola sp. TaxID=1872138 RepID=UPI002DBAA92F|nr:TetR/AcrR family transcriptional regulator [Actinophytocola sp.]HEU5469501.1 TetR/AcrR family transcriptional regulator [Actinophytocola sp.]